MNQLIVLFAGCLLVNQAVAHDKQPLCQRFWESFSQTFWIPPWKTLGSVRVLQVPLSTLLDNGFAHSSIASGPSAEISHDKLLKELTQAFPQYHITCPDGVQLITQPGLAWHENWRWRSLAERANLAFPYLRSIRNGTRKLFYVRAARPLDRGTPPVVIWPMEGPHASRAFQSGPGQWTFYVDSTLTSPPRLRSRDTDWTLLMADFVFQLKDPASPL